MHNESIEIAPLMPRLEAAARENAARHEAELSTARRAATRALWIGYALGFATAFVGIAGFWVGWTYL